jgi:hypothetical protein
MRRTLVVACAVFALVTGTLAVLTILEDRQDALRVVEERTGSMARMIVAHADTALDAAQNVITKVAPLVAAWDFEDNARAVNSSTSSAHQIEGTPMLSSAWVMDGKGISRLDTWTYPAKPIDGSSRPYFKAHLAGADDPVIMGDDRPGTITGEQRFTYSRAVRKADGSLHAVLVVAIYRANFDTLYGEAANWPGASAGLQTLGSSSAGPV